MFTVTVLPDSLPACLSRRISSLVAVVRDVQIQSAACRHNRITRTSSYNHYYADTEYLPEPFVITHLQLSFLLYRPVTPEKDSTQTIIFDNTFYI